jgi:sulfate adenylyltransferase
VSDPVQPDALIQPHGGWLVDLIVDAGRAADLRAASHDWPAWDLTPRQLCDLELLANGGFSPLAGFMTSADYDAVCERMRLADGTLWPMPIALDVSETFADALIPGQPIALRDAEGVMLAVLHVAEMWTPNKDAEARLIFGTNSDEHPGVAALARGQPVYVGGRVEAIQLPIHYDYQALRQTPAEVRADFAARAWRRVVAFQTRNPMHRAHQELTRRAAEEAGANLLLHPSVGLTKPGDVDHYTRVRCYQAVLASYPPGTTKLALLPLAMRMGGPREAVWHAIIRKNYGCTHFIVGRDHAGPGGDASGTPFYGPYDAQEMLRAYERELGVEMVPFRNMVYVRNLDRYVPENESPPGADVLDLSGTQLRKMLADGTTVPGWFTFPAVADELRRSHPPRLDQGLTIFFTGLSGSGKSTIANALLVKLLEIGGRSVTLLDGDIVRKHLSSELGFSKAHRDINIRRIGFVASEITKAGGIALCAPIAPYDAIRKEARAMVEPFGGFVLVYVSTPIEICEQRDRKGLYAKARAGVVQHFTGVSDPYEPPTDADVVIDTVQTTPEEEANRILEYVRAERYLDG